MKTYIINGSEVSRLSVAIQRVETMLYPPAELRLIPALMFLCLPHRGKRQVLLLKVMGTQVLHAL